MPTFLIEDRTPSPGTHALVIGVNHYRHLTGGSDAHKASVLKRLEQLDSPVPSALHFANWLKHDYVNTDAPLRSLQVLLSPGPFVDAKTGVEEEVQKAEMKEILAAFREWEKLCAGVKGNVAIFYFCGHGFEKGSQCLLPEDFGNDSTAEEWLTCINFNLTFEAMARVPVEAQCYFIDACRDDPGKEANVPSQIGQSLKKTSFAPAIPRDGAVYLAARPGRTATGIASGVSPFTHALVECLGRYGAGTTHREDDDGPWWVTTDSLRSSLLTYLAHHAVNDDIIYSSGMSKCDVQPRQIHLQDRADCGVLCPVRFHPEAAAGEAEVEFRQNGQPLAAFEPTVPLPWCAHVGMGDCDLQAHFTSYADVSRKQTMLPPVQQVRFTTQPRVP